MWGSLWPPPHPEQNPTWREPGLLLLPQDRMLPSGLVPPCSSLGHSGLWVTGQPSAQVEGRSVCPVAGGCGSVFAGLLGTGENMSAPPPPGTLTDSEEWPQVEGAHLDRIKEKIVS